MRAWLVIAVCACGTKEAPSPPAHHVEAQASPRGLVPPGSITAGEHHACAVEATGRVMCWGKGGAGRLGTPDDLDRAKPVELPGLEGIAGVASGEDITCAWTTRGSVLCWGGEDESTAPSDHRPRRVPHLDDIVQVIAGQFGACGLHANGRIACWSPPFWRDPLWPRVEDLEGVSDAVEIAGDEQQICARLASGHVTCRIAPDANHEKAFTILPELDGATNISGSGEQFAALLPGRRLALWNIGDLEGRHGGHPPVVHHFDDIDGQRVVVAGRQVCVIAKGATCWGFDVIDTASPEPTSPKQTFADGMQDLAPGFDMSCARRADRVECWSSKDPHTAHDVPGLTLGEARRVTPTVPPPEPIATAAGAPTVLKPRPMHGPFRTGVAACKAQPCPHGRKDDYCEDEVAQYVVGPFMPKPPAPFSEVRLIRFECNNPDNPSDDYERVRMMVTRADGVWLSDPIAVLGAPGKTCGSLAEPRWRTRELSGKHDVVLSLVEGANCKDPRSPVEHALLVVAADAKQPVTYGPIVTDLHVTSFVRDQVIVDGVGTYQFAPE